MDNDQLTFSDDPLLTGTNEVFQLIEEGNFSEAVIKLDNLMNINPDYPGLPEAYRTAKFWLNRSVEIECLLKGKQKADFLMREWEDFKKYSDNYKITETAAYNSAIKYIFYNASENYKIAFKEQESTTDNFNLLLNLGMCFLILGEYKDSIETLEYARSSNRNSARLNSLLGEAYFHTNEISRSLLFFKEAFFIDPSQIDLGPLKSKPVQDMIAVTKIKKPGCTDIREYMPVFAYTEDIFYARRNLNTEQVEEIKREIFTLEKNLNQITREKAEETNIIPRLINKYIWMLDYFRFQKYDYENIVEIKNRLIQLDKEIFEEYFKAHEIK
jgi:tetratricopeptide (TPR) repeat protein